MKVKYGLVAMRQCFTSPRSVDDLSDGQMIAKKVKDGVLFEESEERRFCMLLRVPIALRICMRHYIGTASNDLSLRTARVDYL